MSENKPKRPASSTSWILVAMWVGCVAVASPAYIAFKAKTGDAALALILFIAIAAMLCACAWQIYRQIDTFKGKKRDTLKDNERTAVQQATIAPATSNIAAADTASNTSEEATSKPIEESITATEDDPVPQSLEPTAHAEVATSEPQPIPDAAPKFPALIRDARGRVLFDGLVAANILKEDYTANGNRTNALLAYIVATIAEIVNLPLHWQEFESLWNIRSLRQTYNQIGNNANPPKQSDVINSVIFNTGKSSAMIRDLAKFIQWSSRNNMA